MLGGNRILTLDEAAGVLPRPDVPEDDVALYSAKERDPGTDEHGNACDNEALNEPGPEKPLNGDLAIHVNMPDAASVKLRDDVGRIPRHTLHDSPERGKHASRGHVRITVAGAPPPAAFIERLEKELGWEFMQIYGLTETAPLLTISIPDDSIPKDDYARRSRAGVPGIGVELQVLDDDGRPCPQDDQTVGEICARSNVVFAGYWAQPDETAKAIRNGFFHTGDLAVWDETGNIQVTDRKKDLIISGGENISSPEIEDALYKHPAVRECAVIGVPHKKWGETPKALVVKREGQDTSEKELIAFCRKHIAHFKCPSSVDFVPSLPRTATGKLQKFRLREQYWKGESAP